MDYTPQLEESFRQRYKRPVGMSWRMDEPYIKVKGRWIYLYRAVDNKVKQLILGSQNNGMSLQSVVDIHNKFT
jgi:transposase-like protein